MDENAKPLPDVDKQPVVVFAGPQRAELLNLYAGFAMQAQIALDNDVTPRTADFCVQAADTLICALERYHTAELAKMGGGDPEAAGARDDRKH